MIEKDRLCFYGAMRLFAETAARRTGEGSRSQLRERKTRKHASGAGAAQMIILLVGLPLSIDAYR